MAVVDQDGPPRDAASRATPRCGAGSSRCRTATASRIRTGTGNRIVDGPRLNLITAHDDCDPIAATPYHKNVAVHLAPVVGVEAEAAEAASARVRAVAASHSTAAFAADASAAQPGA